MKTLTISTLKSDFIINFPTSLSEITSDYLEKITQEIEIGIEHSLVAIIYREKLANVINSSKKNVPLSCAVVPKFIKSGDTESKFIQNLKINDTLIITGTDIARGIHVNCANNELSINNICSICKLDSSSYKTALTTNEYFYFVEFKLIPNCDIHGKVAQVKEHFNTFITQINRVKCEIGETYDPYYLPGV